MALGYLKSVTITCISDLGWLDSQEMISDATQSGGISGSQWDKSWNLFNAAGSSSLITAETLEGKTIKFLIDCGWGEEYMRQRYQETGVVDLLKNGEIEFLFISHEHLDHLWGLQTILRIKPDITIAIPSTFSSLAREFIRGNRPAPTHVPSNCDDLVKHTGKIIEIFPGWSNRREFFAGCIGVGFELPINLGINGEQSIYLRIKDKGTVCVTGCCHQGVTALTEVALNNVNGPSDKLYGLYGGLHIAPFGEPLSPPLEDKIEKIEKFGFAKIAANHCTGSSAIQRMIDLGLPVVKGKCGKIEFTNGEKNMVYSPLSVGNGDSVQF